MDLIAHFSGARNARVVPSGVVLFQEGDPATGMYVLMDGTVDISVGGDVVEVAETGALLGEMALVDPGPRSATAVSRTQCTLIALDVRGFDMLVRESPEFARHVMQVMAARLRRMNARLREALGELNVRGRRPA